MGVDLSQYLRAPTDKNKVLYINKKRSNLFLLFYFKDHAVHFQGRVLHHFQCYTWKKIHLKLPSTKLSITEECNKLNT